MYKKVSTSLNFVENELATEKFWKENDIFRKSMENYKMFTEVSEKWVRINSVLKPHKTQDPICLG